MKKFYLLAALAMMTMGAMAQTEKKAGMLIGAESVADLTSLDEKAAAEWFETVGGEIITPSTLDKIAEVNTLWIAIDRKGIERGWEKLPAEFISDDALNAINDHVQAGGTLLLTNHATQLTVALGRISDAYAPNIFGADEENNLDPWGIQPVIGNTEGQVYDHSAHVIYTGMTYADHLNGEGNPMYGHDIYTLEGGGLKGNHNCMWDLNKYGFTADPNTVVNWEEATNSTVLGTWQHVADYCCAGIVDFEPTTDLPARILAIGMAAYEWDLGGEGNAYVDQVQLLTANSLDYLLDSSTKVIDNGEGGETDAIKMNTVEKQNNNSFYTITGVKVANPKQSGVYITGNKKVVLK